MRVLLANQPQLLRECLAAAIVGKADFEVVMAAATAAAILRSVEELRPDCLILSLEVREANPRICRSVLNRYPHTLILSIGPKTLTVYWFEVIVRSARRECSLATILDLLRTKLAGKSDHVPHHGNDAGVHGGMRMAMTSSHELLDEDRSDICTEPA